MYLRSSRFVELLNGVSQRQKLCGYERIIVKWARCGKTVSAKMMFVPEKVMNREETHLNECVWTWHAESQKSAFCSHRRISCDLTATRQNRRRDAKVSDRGLIGCQENLNPVPLCAEWIRHPRDFNAQKPAGSALRQQMRSGDIRSVLDVVLV